MLVEQIAKHVNRNMTQVHIPAFDRMRIEIKGRGDLIVMDMGYNDASRILSMGFSLHEREKLGRVYLPLWYTPRMFAAYIDALVLCATHKRDAAKLDEMLDGYNPQERRGLALERLAAMSYVDGYEVWAVDQQRILWKEQDNEMATIFEMSPVDDYYLRFAMMDAYGSKFGQSWRMDYCYDTDDIVAYMTVCRSILEQHQHQAVTA